VLYCIGTVLYCTVCTVLYCSYCAVLYSMTHMSLEYSFRSQTCWCRDPCSIPKTYSLPLHLFFPSQAGLPDVVAQALCCPKLNVLTERCRLLGGWLGFTELRMAAVRHSSESLGRKSKSKKKHKAQQQQGVARASKGGCCFGTCSGGRSSAA
jgi:hypothetical protein